MRLISLAVLASVAFGAATVVAFAADAPKAPPASTWGPGNIFYSVVGFPKAGPIAPPSPSDRIGTKDGKGFFDKLHREGGGSAGSQ